MNLQGRNLSLSLQGDDVALLQRKLGQLGYNLAPSEIEGRIFRNTTREAVLDFQRKRGLEATGVVDEHTARQINAAVDALPSERYLVSGQVRHQDGAPLGRMTVRAFDKDLRDEEPLGEETTTDDNGQYEIAYTVEQFSRAEKHRADLIVRVFSPEGRQIAESQLLFNAPPVARVDVVVRPQPPMRLSEYERLLADLAPLLEDAP